MVRNIFHFIPATLVLELLWLMLKMQVSLEKEIYDHKGQSG